MVILKSRITAFYYFIELPGMILDLSFILNFQGSDTSGLKGIDT